MSGKRRASIEMYTFSIYLTMLSVHSETGSSLGMQPCAIRSMNAKHLTMWLRIIIILIIIIIISFMQGIYTYIPETKYVPREYSVAAILLLLFMVLISLVPVLNLLYFYISTFRSMCAVPNMAVFCSSLTSCFSNY